MMFYDHNEYLIRRHQALMWMGVTKWIKYGVCGVGIFGQYINWSRCYLGMEFSSFFVVVGNGNWCKKYLFWITS